MTKRLLTYSTPEIRVTFDPYRCIHAGECIRRQPAVFDSSRMRWIRPELGEPGAIADAVAHCPTGALHYRLTSGATEELGDRVVIASTRDGPLYQHRAVTIETEDGRRLAEDGRVALCRCGKTGFAPFCDGSHRRARFRDPPGAPAFAPEPAP
jgi:uncharacterized Fe-S cluster protein YjdI/CDGSH-type Zn-finger protein